MTRFSRLPWALLSVFLLATCSETTEAPAPPPPIDDEPGDQDDNEPDVSLCELPSPPPICQTGCVLDVECGTGFHCNSQGTCDSFCNADGDECESDEVCSSRGLCVSSGGGGNDECPNVLVNVEPVIPTVIVLVDRSGSMIATFQAGQTRWEAVRDALTDETDGVMTVLGDRIRFGTTLYNSVGGGSVPDQCPILRAVEPSFATVGEVRTLFADNAPEADTPTGESILQVAENFPASDGPRIIVLATDGDPDTCAVPNPQTADAQVLSEQATQTAFDMGVETFVLSVGSGVSEDHLQRVANAGRGQNLASGTAPFFVANNTEQMVTDFNTIIRGARSCEFTLNASVVMDEANTGTVILNGASINYGTDWQVKNETTLELLGASCTTFRETDNVSLAAEFPCGAVLID